MADRYRNEGELGQGGMATVYLAEDLRHRRKVALKVLKPDLAAVLGAERFVQEITTTASLQHPHILPLFDSGSAEGFLYYVMPFVDGETLRAKLNRETQLSIDEAVGIATSVADALDYAHRHGVIHRDIKPENILLHDGRPVVADFGIALAVSAAAGGRMTETGLSLGTPHYMSPEQATAEKELTNRSDIYSLASVLYEMLSGSPPHVGSSAQQIIMKIVTDEARPVTELRKSVPPYVGAALAKALEKLPADRFATAHEFGEALHDRGFPLGPGGTAVVSGAGVRSATRLGWRGRLRDPVLIIVGLIAVAALVAAAGLARRQPTAPLPPIQFVLATSDSTRPAASFPWPAAISPDGGTVVYSVGQTSANALLTLYMQRLGELEQRPIPGTAGAYQPYFSPDGRWLAFEVGGQERKVRLDGSAPVAIGPGGSANGGTWTPGNDIVLGAQSSFSGLSHMSAAGGEPVEFTRVDSTKGEVNHLWPIATPDGKAIVFTIWSGTLPTSKLAMISSAGGAVTRLGVAGIRPLAVLDGMLVYVQADGAVMAVALDVGRRRVRGQPIPVHDPVAVSAAVNGNSEIYVSSGGAMITSRGGALSRLVWIGRDGRAEPLTSRSRAFTYVRLSPDERRVAAVIAENLKTDVWIYDLGQKTFSRLTTAGTVTSVDWTPDGSGVVFTAQGTRSPIAVWSQSASGGTQAKELSTEGGQTASVTTSPDGKSLLLTTIPQLTWDLYRVSVDSPGVMRPYIATSAQEHAPRFSPDGKWVAFASDESGQDEVYVRSYPDPSSKIQISVGGGFEPMWSPDGNRVYYRSGTALLAARVSRASGFSLAGQDTVIAYGFTTGTLQGGYFSGTYQPSRDVKRVLTIQADRNDYQLVVAPNWIAELRRRVAEAGSRP
ncbi:MAG: protein kinase domain-containing protein [Gemmatimonadales bacterium]